MKEEKTIQISLQLPVSELQTLTSLAQQLQALMNQGRNSIPAASGTETNPGFDAARFQELSANERTAELTALSDPETVIERAETHISAALSEGETVFSDPEAPLSQGDIPREPLLTAEESSTVETARQADFPEFSGTDSQRHQEPAAAAPESRYPPFPSVTSQPEGAATAARAVQSAADPVAAAPSTLTAEAVSQAFRRDDRRYDNGFPLY